MKRLAALLLCLLLLCPGALAEDDAFVLYHGDRSEKRVAITMDDCYEPLNIQRTLDICREHNVPITFFVLGMVLEEQHRDMWQQAIDLGCEIGNHTWGHLDLSTKRTPLIRHQLSLTQQQLDTVLGYHYPMQVMRPPYGNLSKGGSSHVVEAIAAEGYKKIALWDVSQTNAAIAKRQVQNGSILLYHANYKDVECLRELIPYLIEQGYEIVTVSDLLGLPPVQIQAPAAEEAAPEA